MRGIDYRLAKIIEAGYPEPVISLWILQTFSSKRTAMQAMGRVGRQGDRCSRQRLKGLPIHLVD